MKCEVIVGNIGMVYSGTSPEQAGIAFDEYVKQSKAGVGRAAGEPVTIMADGSITQEYNPDSPEASAMGDDCMVMNMPKEHTIKVTIGQWEIVIARRETDAVTVQVEHAVDGCKEMLVLGQPGSTIKM